jgi:hypothetical protein
VAGSGAAVCCSREGAAGPVGFININAAAAAVFGIDSQVAQQRYDAVLKGQPERLVSGSDDHTMRLATHCVRLIAYMFDIVLLMMCYVLCTAAVSIMHARAASN